MPTLSGLWTAGLRGEGREDLKDDGGQMCVELAVLMPVVIVVALIVYNLSSYLVICAEFDRASQNAIVLLGVSPSGEQTAASAAGQVRSSIVESVGHEDRCDVEVTSQRVSEDDSGGEFVISPLLTRYTCRLSFHPWPSSFVLAGVSIDSPLVLSHERTLVVDRFRPGVVM